VNHHPLVSYAARDAVNTGTAGVVRGVARASAVASRVANSGGAHPAELARDAVGLLETRREIQANAAVVRSANRMLGNLLDVFA
jgi:hypothetical protein